MPGHGEIKDAVYRQLACVEELQPHQDHEYSVYRPGDGAIQEPEVPPDEPRDNPQGEEDEDSACAGGYGQLEDIPG
jgi:hypothetical protein